MDKPNDWPKIVYKYRSWETDNHKKILSENQVFLSSPEKFNDPFDCRITPKVALLDTPEKREKYVWTIINRHVHEIEAAGKKVDEVYADFLNRVNNQSEYQEEVNRVTFKMQNERYGILSLSLIWDSILMWSHYSNNHTGICVGFHEEKMRNSELFGSGAKVRYSSDFPEYSPMEDFKTSAFNDIFHKATNWEYEKEYRLTKTYLKEAAKEDRIVTLSDECYAEITLGISFCRLPCSSATLN